MKKIQVTFVNGHTIDGKITNMHSASHGQLVLVVEGKTYSGMDAINQGLSLFPVDDPVVDKWLETSTSIKNG